VRLRENAEGVALYRGEDQEQRGLLGRFGFVLENWWQIMRSTKRLNAFSAGYSQIAIVFPFIVAAPRYFSGEIDLGTLMQIGSAFGSVQTALSWFVSNYSSLAEWKAGVDRLLTFHEALTKARARQHQEVPATTASADDGALEVEHLALDLPNGRPILADAAFTIRPGDRVLVTGPSGIGKSTLFRALAGIWPFSRGRIRIPRGASLLFLPQKPYIPIGSLRESVAYPAPADAFTDDEVREALSAVRLDAFRERLDERTNWSMLMSGGEQQKLAIARALLHRPGWLFLDEATSALDEENEHHLYGLLASRLPRTTIVSVAHRPGVAQYHDRRLRFQADGNGSMQLVAG
jgi:putative ATP-binding cassette transporter